MGTVGSGVERNLRPPALVALARKSTVDEFVRAIDMPLLLVRTDDLTGEMAQTLEGRGDDAGSRVEPGIGFNTISTERPARRPITLPPPPTFAPAQLLVRVIRACHFIVAIGKRADAGRVFSERVTVGRARNSDIVLRHESVSKFHAWFARDDDNAYFLVDASSRNGTTLNGARVDGGTPARLRNGDLVRFGSVEATYVEAVTLHAALHEK
jgi:hypothetical protein